MKRKTKTRFLVSISCILCQLLSLVFTLSAQVPSQLHSSGTVKLTADSQEKVGDLYRLLGHVELVSGGMRLAADRVTYNAATGELAAAGNIHFTDPARNEDIRASRCEFNLNTNTGSFFDVKGSVGAPVAGSSSLLTTTNPFSFEAERVEKTSGDTYQIYNGEVTACSLPDPIWTFSVPRATIRPGVSAKLYNANFRLLKIPIFYSPFLYHSLRRISRSSGFLMPTVGNSSRWGTVIGGSFFWAINRSADAEIAGRYLSKRGWSQQGTFRMRPTAGSYLNASYFGVEDRGFGPQKIDQGGRTVSAEGVAEMPGGFRGVVNFNYLSSLTFREAFTQTFNEAVNSEVHSTGFLSKNFDSYSVNAFFSRFETFRSIRPKDTISIRHLPRIEFNSVNRQLWRESPLWLSWESAGGTVSRNEPAPEGGERVKTSTLERFHLSPRITIPLRWREFRLTPVFGFRTMHYRGRRVKNRITDESLNRTTQELSVELAFPSVSKVFPGSGQLDSRPLKHVIEPKAAFRYVNGVRDFQSVLLFDELDLLTNTKELEYSLANRLLAKRRSGLGAQEIVSWELRQRYYFDPSFGGAVVAGRRNLFRSALDLSSHSFIEGPRRFSPLVSLFRFRPSSHYDIEFRQDYDTTRGRLTHGGLVGNSRWGDAFVSVSHFFVRSSEILSAPSNQVRFLLGYGNLAKPGLNAAFAGTYDIRSGFMQFSAFQVSYNNDCCGISVEFRRFALGAVRNENQFRVAFSIANVGTFGNMKRQERLF